MANKLFMGVDTSCYTTSIAFMDEFGQLVYSDKTILKVKEGQKGLRQSEGFYQHMFNLEELYSKAVLNIDMKKVTEIVVSEKPRDLSDSYMPVFNSGTLFSKYLSSGLSIPYRLSNHQQNHILSTMYGCDLPLEREYVSFHLSGGTTDILRSQWHGTHLDIENLGGSLDVSFGQLVDRLGILLGIPFPCGKEMDAITKDFDFNGVFPIRIKDLTFNLSGYENKFKDALKYGDSNDCIITLFNTIVAIIDKLIKLHFKDTPVILTGGVSANSRLIKHFESNKNVHLADGLYAMDHAIGNSYLGYLNREK